MANQEAKFLEKEGNAWFERNKKALYDPEKLEKDLVLQLIKDAEIKPQRVLEIGCSNGYRLGQIEEKYRCHCVGLDPSLEAINDGKKLYPNVQFKQGFMADLPVEGVFDLVIIHFVFHWVSREVLLKSIAEADRVVSNSGFLIIGDFLPDHPMKNHYHHLAEGEVYTYKLDYANLFVSSGFYREEGRIIFDHDDRDNKGEIPPASRAACLLLKKVVDDLYQWQKD